MSSTVSNSPADLSGINSLGVAPDLEKGQVQYRENVVAPGPPPVEILPPSRMGNPGALGLFAFGTTLWVLSCFLYQVRGIVTPNVVVGMTLFTGGLVLFLSGLYSLSNGNCFGGTAFAVFAGFWASYGFILLPSTGAAAAYTVPGEFESAVGIFLSGWLVVSILFLIASLRTNAAFITIFSLLSMLFVLLMAGYFVNSTAISITGAASTTGVNLIRAGGIVGMLLSILAWYVGLSELLATMPGSYALPVALPSKKTK